MLDKLLDYTIKSKSSDLHISVGNYPTTRIDGDLVPIPNSNKLDDKVISNMLSGIMREQQFSIFKQKLDIDFSLHGKDDIRFRVNVFKDINGMGAVFRVIPAKVMRLGEMGVPEVITDLCKLSRGLVLVVGPTGSGKSTTLAAMVDNIAHNYKYHIITIEDPVEFVHNSSKSLINQREVGTDTLSFANALRGALREDPDVILVGEMRDLETIRLALTAAETGHLVFATLHTNSAAQTINRIIDVFPGNDKGVIRSMLSSSLEAVISQRLIKKKGGGRCAAYEIMLSNNSIRNLIREDKVPQITSIIEISKKQGMVTMKDSILKLINKDFISTEEGERLLSSLGQNVYDAE